MKRLGWLVAILALGWSLLWLGGAIASERLIAAWLQDRAAAGWTVSHDGIETSGYPTRFTTRIGALTLADPFTDWGVDLPEFGFIQPATRPGQITAVFPEDYLFSGPYETLAVRAERLDTTMRVRLLENFALDRSETVMRGLQLQSDLGWTAALADGRLSFARQGDSLDYRLELDASGVVPARQLRLMLDPAGLLPDALDRLQVDAVTAFDRAWDLSALERARPAPTRFDLTALLAEWGDLALRVSGRLDIDATGIPSGTLALRASNWRSMLDIAENGGALSEGMRRTLESALAILAGLNGTPEDLDTTLTFSDGQVFLGPVPLGPAPRLILR